MAIVLRAKTAGFCMGVGLALRKLDQALKEHRARSSLRRASPTPMQNPAVLARNTVAIRSPQCCRWIKEA